MARFGWTSPHALRLELRDLTDALRSCRAARSSRRRSETAAWCKACACPGRGAFAQGARRPDRRSWRPTAPRASRGPRSPRRRWQSPIAKFLSATRTKRRHRARRRRDRRRCCSFPPTRAKIVQRRARRPAPVSGREAGLIPAKRIRARLGGRLPAVRVRRRRKALRRAASSVHRAAGRGLDRCSTATPAKRRAQGLRPGAQRHRDRRRQHPYPPTRAAEKSVSSAGHRRRRSAKPSSAFCSTL